MARDQPPSEDFLLLLPPNTFGYFMRERKWHNIMIENMSEVCWDKDAFKSLVMDSSTKELIMALVTSQIEPSQATELMSNKGNGLIILLHGGPGTGKTLTAESVAEYTKKPLYRITSGDIGTTPSEVEKYLDVVLDLGRRWDCVVLLDEAEVFLQARTLTDLARNSLVSVFLRVLEYFQGILILTSNRVATFDEAFKSRIQLALYYEPLGRTQREKVWQNFINRLEKVAGSAVDTDDLHENVDKLAEVNMNGRQIRNAMTTARQLAMFRKQRMDFETLNYIIGVSQKFDKYLSQVNEGMTDEELARDEGVR
ncbi:P-loop containing nucleoside triphosphate hydrolase protein [Phyllosticta capitalensis]